MRERNFTLKVLLLLFWLAAFVTVLFHTWFSYKIQTVPLRNAAFPFLCVLGLPFGMPFDYLFSICLSHSTATSLYPFSMVLPWIFFAIAAILGYKTKKKELQ